MQSLSFTSSRFRLLRTRVALVAGAVLAAACGGSSEPKVPPKDLVPATITSNISGTLTAVAGTTVATPLTVTVANKAGEPLDTVLVTFAVTSGGGSVSSTTVRTTAGQASTNWTLGSTIGTQTVTATVGTLAPVTFTATATVGAAKNIVKNSADVASAPAGSNVTPAPSVKVTDANNNPVGGVLVTFSVTAGGGSVTGAAVNTDASGVATVGSWKLGNGLGANTLTAAAGGITSTVVFSTTATAGAAATLVLGPQPGELAVGQTASLTATVKDANGNVIANAPLTFASANPAVATVSTTGVVTAVGAGTTTISAASGAAMGAVSVTVVGHPTGTSISNTFQENAVLGDVAFTTNATLVSLGSNLSVQILDAKATTALDTVVTNRFGQFLLAGPKTSGPALQVAAGSVSRITYIDPASGTITDSLDVQELVTKAVISTTGAKAYLLLSDGELATIDVASKTETRLQLGGGTNALRLNYGDSLAYVNTSVGIMFEIDVRTNTIKRQMILPVTGNDFDISRDGKQIYVLNGTQSIVTIVDLATVTSVGSFGVSNLAKTIALTPDSRQVWVTHDGAGTAPAKVTMYARNAAGSYLSAGEIALASNPLRIYFSPSGDFAAITNFGGWVDIVR